MTDKPKAFRLEDVRNQRFYAEHRPDILEAMHGGRIVRPGQAPPADAELVTRSAPSFTRTQLADPAFYAEHRDDIHEALAEGRITE
jgi:hypothetical protein